MLFGEGSVGSEIEGGANGSATGQQGSGGSVAVLEEVARGPSVRYLLDWQPVGSVTMYELTPSFRTSGTDATVSYVNCCVPVLAVSDMRSPFPL